jgi:hypothetical protein
MKSVLSAYLLVALTVGVAKAEATPVPLLSDSSLLAYASTPYDKSAVDATRVLLGTLNGTPIVADFFCSDLCPEYTVRVIHFELIKGSSCSAAKGIEKSMKIPVSRASVPREFCFPKVLTDNWEKYQK